MARIAPSILAADFCRLGEQVAAAERGGARSVHVDAMDGHFVPNLSIGIPVVRSLSRFTSLEQDCHLMLARPDDYLEAFVKAGAGTLTVHQEACPHLQRTVSRIRSLGAKAGVALNPATPLGVLDEILPEVDLVLIMSVNPGFGGQAFLPSSIDKVARLDGERRRRGLSFAIEVDGGVGLGNARQLAEAGCDILVAGSSVFGCADVAAAVRGLAAQSNLPRLAHA